MNTSRLTGRLLRFGPACARRQLSTSRPVWSSTTTTFQSYPLLPPSSTSQAEPPQPRSDPIHETSIAHPTPSTSSQSRSPDSDATSTPSSVSESASPAQVSEGSAQKPKPVRARPRVPRARKAAMRLTPAAVAHLGALLDQPEPKLIRVGVRNRGCSGLAYHLEYVDRPAAFDEEVEQDGVRVLVDSKALFSIIGSEMDWVEDKLNQRFVFRNPNIKEQCGCGESFMV